MSEKEERKFHCSFPECTAKFTRLYRVRRHLRMHTDEKPFLCTIDGCDKAFSCRTYLNKHMKRPHKADDQVMEKKEKSLKTYQCDHCEKVFKHKFNLKIHATQHNSEEKPFKCSTCKKSFALKSRLTRHLKVHNGYNCNHDNCDFKAEKWTCLQKHIATDHRLLNKCDKCSSTFIKPSGLAAHLLTHEEVKHFNCVVENCGKQYLNKSNLKAHIRAVHERQFFKCPSENCSSEFRHRVTLKRHMAVHDAKTNVNKTTKKEKPIYIKRVSMATKLSGEEISKIELKQLLIEDKEYRKNSDKIV